MAKAWLLVSEARLLCPLVACHVDCLVHGQQGGVFLLTDFDSQSPKRARGTCEWS